MVSEQFKSFLKVETRTWRVRCAAAAPPRPSALLPAVAVLRGFLQQSAYDSRYRLSSPSGKQRERSCQRGGENIFLASREVVKGVSSLTIMDSEAGALALLGPAHFSWGWRKNLLRGDGRLGPFRQGFSRTQYSGGPGVAAGRDAHGSLPSPTSPPACSFFSFFLWSHRLANRLLSFLFP